MSYLNPHWFMCLNTWSPDDGAVWKVVDSFRGGGGALLEEVGQWRQAWQIYSPISFPVYSLLPYYRHVPSLSLSNVFLQLVSQNKLCLSEVAIRSIHRKCLK